MIADPSDNQLLSLIEKVLPAAVGLVGAVIGGFAAYFISRSQFKSSIEKMLIERRIHVYEQTLQRVIEAEGTQHIILDDRTRIGVVSRLLRELTDFHLWYERYQSSWYPSQYLLDWNAREKCNNVHQFVADLFNKYPSMRRETHTWPPLSPDDTFAVHTTFLSHLTETHKALEKWLRKIHNVD
jgi:hypothetical protein